jgi:hypothetical protein
VDVRACAEHSLAAWSLLTFRLDRCRLTLRCSCRHVACRPSTFFAELNETFTKEVLVVHGLRPYMLSLISRPSATHMIVRATAVTGSRARLRVRLSPMPLRRGAQTGPKLPAVVGGFAELACYEPIRQA